MVLSPKNHDFQLRTCFFAIFAARVLAGRAVVEKRLKRCLKRYPGGPVAVKTPCETHLVRKRQKRPIWTHSCRRPGGAAPRHGVVIFWQCFSHDFLPNRVLKRRLFKIYFLGRKNGFGPPPAWFSAPKITISSCGRAFSPFLRRAFWPVGRWSKSARKDV